MGRGGLSDAEWSLIGTLLPSERGRWARREKALRAPLAARSGLRQGRCLMERTVAG